MPYKQHPRSVWWHIQVVHWTKNKLTKWDRVWRTSPAEKTRRRRYCISLVRCSQGSSRTSIQTQDSWYVCEILGHGTGFNILFETRFIVGCFNIDCHETILGIWICRVILSQAREAIMPSTSHVNATFSDEDPENGAIEAEAGRLIANIKIVFRAGT